MSYHGYQGYGGVVGQPVGAPLAPPPARGGRAHPSYEEQQPVLHMPSPWAKPRERRTNVLGLAVALFLPWLIFCGMFYSAFVAHHEFQNVAQGIQLTLFILLATVSIYYIHQVCRRWRDQDYSPDWAAFIALTSLMALVLGVLCGGYQYRTNMSQFYDVTSLNYYADLDPTRTRGQEFMDAGRVLFVEGTYLDVNKSMGFRNQDTYCVAPITARRAAPDGAATDLASYDFWAVGVDCCTSGRSDFKCGDYANPHARSGLRAMRDSERGFYRLAVQQAQATHNIKSDHPLFFYWVQDTTREAARYEVQGYRYFAIGMFVYFMFQLLLVACAGYTFANPQNFWHIKSLYY